jgi:WD40 repeat protein
VVTDGVVAWDATAADFDWHQTTALPRSLHGMFDAEPRWVDFRWARTQDHLSLNDPRFRDGVTDLAAPLHGQAKEELFGEDVRQHRRTKALARSAIAMVSALAIVASSAALVAVRNGHTAERERDRAEQRLRLAVSRQLAATAELNATTRPLQSILLNVQAFNEADTIEARRGLLKQLQNLENVKGLLGGHTSPACAVAFSPDGHTVASGDYEGTIRTWDVGSRRTLASFAGDVGAARAVAFSPDGRILASAGQTEDSRKIVTLWDVARRVRLATLTGGLGWVSHVAFSPDGRTLAADSGKSIALWDVARRTRVAILTGNGRGRRTQVAFSPDGRTLAADRGDEITLWDVARRIPIATLAGHRDTVTSMAFAPDGRSLASVSDDHTVRFWDVTRRARPATLPGDRRLTTLTDPGDVWSGVGHRLAFSPDGRTLAVTTGTGREIYLWDVKHRTGLGILTGHVDYTCAVAFSSDSHTLVSSGSDGLIRLWSLAHRHEPTSPNTLDSNFPYVSRIVFSPNGRILALTRGDNRTISLWDVAHRSRIATLPNARSAAAFSPDGRTLATASGDRTVRLWNPAKPARPTAVLRGHTGAVSDLTFSPDGRTLATASSDGTVCLWDIANRTRLTALPGYSHDALGPGDPIPMVFSRDGRTLGFSSGRAIHVWDVARRSRLAAISSRKGWVSTLALTPDGRTLAFAGDDSIVLWNVARRIPIATLTGPRNETFQVAFGNDGRTLASASFDGTVRLWDVASGTELGTLAAHKSPVFSLAFSPDSRALASGSYDGAVRVSDTSVTSWRQRLCAIASRSFTRAEWAEFLPQQTYQKTCGR